MPYDKFKKVPVVFITALREESRVVLEWIPAKKIISEKTLKLWQLKNTSLYLMEVGRGIRVDAGRITAELRQLGTQVVINYGFCGALDPGVPPFQFYSVEKICSINEETISVFQPLPEALKSIATRFQTASLLTVKSPVLDRDTAGQVYKKTGCLLVDMEAYQIARICSKTPLTLLVFKVVSDRANKKSGDDVKKNAPRLRKLLQEKLGSVLEELN